MKREERLARWSVGLEGEARIEELCYRRHHLRFIDHSLCGGGGGECVDRANDLEADDARAGCPRRGGGSGGGGRLSSLNRVAISYLETLYCRRPKCCQSVAPTPCVMPRWLLPFSPRLISPISASSLFRDSWAARGRTRSCAKKAPSRLSERGNERPSPDCSPPSTRLEGWLAWLPSFVAPPVWQVPPPRGGTIPGCQDSRANWELDAKKKLESHFCLALI